MAIDHWIKILFLLYLNGISTSQGRVKRCYTCRSRGELGDCKDPFTFNATTVEENKGVEAAPCASGWCAKTVDAGNGDFDMATERMCVQRPPVDGEERCSTTVIERRPVYMCFCIGDLCNGSFQKSPVVLNIATVCLVVLGLQFCKQIF